MLWCVWLFSASKLDTYDLNTHGVYTQKNIANHGISTKKIEIQYLMKKSSIKLNTK